MQIVIVGNSAAGLNGLEAFRKLDQDSEVTIIAKEEHRPYSRVLLPYYLRGKVPYENLFIRDKGYYERLRAKYISGKVVKLLPEQQQVLLECGTSIPYDKLLIATGSSPVKPPIPGLSGAGVHHLSTLEDIRQLNPRFEKDSSVAVLGSGFVSLQGAYAALTRGLSVTVVELMDRIMPKALDAHGADMLANRMKESGVNLLVNTQTNAIERTDLGKFVLNFNNTATLTSDFIIVGTGVRPNVDFLEDTEIKIDAGIVVNKQMETTVPGIYAAGDVAQIPSFTDGESVVHALWPTAVETGTIAGGSMASGNESYKGSLNMNVTQLFDITVASMGEFMDAEDSESWIDTSLPQDQYLKVILKKGVPVGATCVGSSELVTTLGMLRPLIREKVQLLGKPEMLKEIMAQNISQHHQAFAK